MGASYHTTMGHGDKTSHRALAQSLAKRTLRLPFWGYALLLGRVWGECAVVVQVARNVVSLSIRSDYFFLKGLYPSQTRSGQ